MASSQSSYQKRLESYARRHFPGVSVEDAIRNPEVRAAARGHTKASPKTVEGAVALALAAVRDPDKYGAVFESSAMAQAALREVIDSRPDLLEQQLAGARRYGREGELTIEAPPLRPELYDVQPLTFNLDVGQSYESIEETTWRPMIFDTPEEAMAYYAMVPVPVVIVPEREGTRYRYRVRVFRNTP